MKYALALVLLAATTASIGCGGGAISAPASTKPPVVQTPSPPPNPPPPTPPVTPAKHYHLTDLIPLTGATDCQANAIAKDHAAGYSVFWSGGVGTARATFWHDGVADDLGSGEASAINSSDLIVGFVLQGDDTPHATLWDHGLVTDLGLLTGFDSSLATGINDSGEVVGIAYVFANPNNEVGFKWTQQTGMQAIDGSATASGVNSKGDIAGMGQNLRAAIFTATGTTIALGTLGDFSLAGAVNNQGHAVGYSPLVANGPVHAFFFDGTSMRDLGAFGAGDYSVASSINDDNLVVGNDTVPASGTGNTRAHVQTLELERMMGVAHTTVIGSSRAMIWSATTGMVDLNSLITADSGWELVTASGINSAGEIVGAAVGAVTTHGYLLTPEN
jgi:probable HAF family extracellular repeat protein